MELIDFALDLVQKAGVVGMFLLFTWLWMTGRIISASELKRINEAHAREKDMLRDSLKHERAERVEWKSLAIRGTALATFAVEKSSEAGAT